MLSITKVYFLPIILFILITKSMALPPSSIKTIDDGNPEILLFNNKNLKKMSSITEIRFNKVKIQNNKKSEELEFSIPAGAISFAVNIHSNSKTDYTYIDTLKNPSNLEVISNNPLGVDPKLISDPRVGGRGQRLSLNAMHYEAFTEISSTPVPNNSKVIVKSGKWKLIVSSENSSMDVIVVILVKVLKGTLDSKTVGNLNLNVSATNTSGYFGSLKDLNVMLSKTKELYKNIGINLSIIDFKTLDSKYDLTSDSAQSKPDYYERLKELFKSNAKLDRKKAIDVFLVKRNNYANLGIASLNGASTMFSSGIEKFGGVVVWTEPHVDNQLILSHEIGHHLGLYHTDSDTFLDTSTVAHWLGTETQIKPNLMHVGNRSDLVLSKEQQDVVRKNVGVALYKE